MVVCKNYDLRLLQTLQISHLSGRQTTEIIVMAGKQRSKVQCYIVPLISLTCSLLVRIEQGRLKVPF